MVGGYMSGSKRAKRTPSITNNICNWCGDYLIINVSALAS
jgi:hypothetical protein